MADKVIYKAFGRAVCTRRKELKLTQALLAARVGMSRASIANLESGRQNVLLHHAYHLAAALKFSRIHDLLPALPKLETENQVDTDKSVTARGKAELSSLIAAALATRNPAKAES